jgi:hypothetical protein
MRNARAAFKAAGRWLLFLGEGTLDTGSAEVTASESGDLRRESRVRNAAIPGSPRGSAAQQSIGADSAPGSCRQKELALQPHPRRRACGCRLLHVGPKLHAASDPPARIPRRCPAKAGDPVERVLRRAPVCGETTSEGCIRPTDTAVPCNSNPITGLSRGKPLSPVVLQWGDVMGLCPGAARNAMVKRGTSLGLGFAPTHFVAAPVA